jgi:hypothetical protein
MFAQTPPGIGKLSKHVMQVWYQQLCCLAGLWVVLFGDLCIVLFGRPGDDVHQLDAFGTDVQQAHVLQSSLAWVHSCNGMNDF